MVKCEICGYTSEKMLSQHLRLTHKISSKEYLELYPNSAITSESYKKMMSDRNKSDKMREIVINRNKSEKMRSIVSNRNRNPDFIEKCKKGMNRTEVKEKQSKRMSERNKTMWQNIDYRNKMCKAISDAQKVHMNLDSVKDRQRKVMQCNWGNDDIAKKMLNAPTSKWKYAKQGIYHSSKFEKDIKYKSTGEYEFLDFCESNDTITDLEYETVHIRFDGKTYTPDFKVTQKGVVYLIEIKYNEYYTDSDVLQWKYDVGTQYCIDNNMQYCWLRRFVELPQLKITQNLNEFALCRNKIE